MGRPLHWIVILQLSYTFAYRYDSWYRADTQRPVDVVTDVVNDLGVKILQQYAAHGNVAFSPTGVAFVLAALYEGSAGRGSQQIAEAAGLPANRDVTRIGFRDIHRRLRSYLNADGFLGGLTLSRENTRLRPEYEDILRFYGFDLSSIEQEANVTVSADGTPGTTELPTSTLGLMTALPTGTTDVESATAMGAITTLPAAGTTIVPSDAGVAQQIPTTAAPSGAQPTSMPMGAGPGGVAAGSQVPQQPPGSPTTVAIGESAQPTPITTATGPAATPADGQTSPSTVTMVTVVVAGDQNTVGPAGGTAQPNVPAVPTPNAAGQAPMPGATTAPTTTGAGTVVAPATLGANTEAPTTVTTDVATVAVAATPADNATLNVATANAAPAPPPMGTAGVTATPSAETAMDNSIVGGMGSAATTIDLTTVPMVDAGGNAAPVGGPGGAAATTTPPVLAANGTSNAVNSNSTALTDNQAAGSLADENAVSTNRRRRRSTEAAGRAGLGLPADNTVKDESTNDRAMSRLRRRARSPRGYFSSYPDEGIWMQDLDIWKSYSTVSPSESSVGDATSEISFLVNGCDISSVSASTYIAVLPFAYFPSLHAVALEFPLDDPRYNIILLMPTDRTDTHRLARDLSGKSLRSLRKRLQPTWVRATIPSFMLRGFVTLTSFLQRLGILDVFEPRVADLSPMTADLGVYARDVQQSIGVNIRNYMKPDRTHSRESSNVESPSIAQPRRDYYRYLPPGNGLFERAGPVPFTALHPFLYFIVDTETSVSLIAGRVDDPLNSRIL